VARRRGLGSAGGDCAVYVGTKNDTNGNPRRGWLVDVGSSTVFVNEGYVGRAALKKACPNAVERFSRIEITPGEYRSLKKLPGACSGGTALDGTRGRRRRRR
jgi:hypothetical protein